LLEIWTNGTVTPQMALVEGSKILRKHLNPFIQYAEPGPEIAVDEMPQPTTTIDVIDAELDRKLNMSLAELELSVRATKLPGIGRHHHRPRSGYSQRRGICWKSATSARRPSRKSSRSSPNASGTLK